jgi:hypothetical protein
VTLDQSKTLVARFSPVALYVDRQSGRGSVSVAPGWRRMCGSGCYAYDYGTQATVTPQPAPDYAFQGWGGGTCNAAPGAVCSPMMYDNVEAIPYFNCVADVCSISQPIERVVETTVTVQGAGEVLVNGKRCTGVCRLRFRRGLPLVLRATGAAFRGWSGWCTGGAPRCQFESLRDPFNNAPRVTARFG